MSENKHPSAGQQAGDFEYSDENWKPVQQLFAGFGGDADTATVACEERSRDGQECDPESLRSRLEHVARLYQLNAEFYPRVTVAQFRKTFQSAHAAAHKAGTLYEQIARSRALLSPDPIDVPEHLTGLGLKLAKELEDFLPTTIRIEAYFQWRLQLLGPYQPTERRRNAAKPELDKYLKELLRIWDQVAPDLETKNRLGSRFLKVVTDPVVGVGSPARARAWLRRVDGGKT